MPRQGLAIDISTLAGSEGVVTTIDDFFFESFSAGEMHPMLTTSRTNLVLYSEAWDNASWSKNAATVEANQIASPLDLNAFTADLLKEDNTNAEHWVRSNNITASLGQTFTMSFYAKAKERTFIKANFLNSGVVSYNVWINLSNGAITSKNANLTVTTELIGSGFYRITLTAQAAATVLNLLVGLATGDANNSYAGDGSSGAYVFGAQIEQDNFVSNYIPTVGSTVSVSTTLNDTSEVWDFDGTDIMIAEDPEDEGFWEEGSNLVLNHNFDDLGSELTTNGGFDTDTWWQKSSANVNISNGKGNFTAGTTEYFYKANTLTIGKTYKVVFEITDRTTGYLSLFGGSFGSPAVSTGTYERYFVCADTSFGLVGNSFVGSIDNVSVKEVVTWTTFGTGVSIASGVFTSDGTSGNYDNILVGATTETWDTSEYYEVTFNVPSYTSGNFKLNNSTHNITSAISASGSYKVYFKPSTANTVIGVQNAGTPFKGTIDNISVKQVDPNDRWDLSGNTSISNGVLNFPGNVSANQLVVHNDFSMLDIGGTYEITLTVNRTSGTMSVRSGLGASDFTPAISINSSGTQTFIVTNNTNGNKLFLFSGTSDNFVGTVDNITAKEYAIQPKDI